jgi:hypothetical protein
MSRDVLDCCLNRNYLALENAWDVFSQIGKPGEAIHAGHVDLRLCNHVHNPLKVGLDLLEY